LLPSVAGFADSELMVILASSRVLWLPYDLSLESIGETMTI
jgi:hypothetical protein